MNNVINTRIKLKTDTTANWNATVGFIPLKGELIIYSDYTSFVSIENGEPVVKYMPNLKIGDGNTYVQDLPFVDVSLIEKGYHNDENGYFYKEKTYTNPLIRDSRKIYIDIPTSELYECDGELYNKLIGIASADKPGLVKLYNNYGQNIDGTMTQKSITEGIDEIEFAVSETDSECLTLTKPW